MLRATPKSPSKMVCRRQRGKICGFSFLLKVEVVFFAAEASGRMSRVRDSQLNSVTITTQPLINAIFFHLHQVECNHGSSTNMFKFVNPSRHRRIQLSFITRTVRRMNINTDGHFGVSIASASDGTRGLRRLRRLRQLRASKTTIALYI